MGRLLDATADESGADANDWDVQYLGNGKPLFVHTETGFRTFDKPRALRAEDAMALLREAAAARPVSSIATMPRESNWYEHRLQTGRRRQGEEDQRAVTAAASENLLFYQNAATGQVSWEDPYECTLQAASDAAERHRRIIGQNHRQGAGSHSGHEAKAEDMLLLEGSWDRHFTRDASRMVYWKNRLTGECSWQEPGSAHIRKAVREAQEAQRAEERERWKKSAEGVEQEKEPLVSGIIKKGHEHRRKSSLFRRVSFWKSASALFGGVDHESPALHQGPPFATIDEVERESSEVFENGVSLENIADLPKGRPEDIISNSNSAGAGGVSNDGSCLL